MREAKVRSFSKEAAGGSGGFGLEGGRDPTFLSLHGAPEATGGLRHTV